MIGDTASSMVGVLTPIWERALRHSSISAEEDFVDLGGDSRSAQELIAEVAQICGRELPPAVLCYAPTISALAAMLEQPVPREQPVPSRLRKNSVSNGSTSDARLAQFEPFGNA
jgi:hypothetical protein